MENNPQVKDFMQTKIVSVKPETPVVSAMRLLYINNLNGLPVIDDEQKVVGVFTEYDLIAQDSSINLSVFLKLVLAFDVYKKEQSMIRADLEKLLALQVKAIMNPEPLMLHPETSLEEAVKTFEEHHKVNPIPVVDSSGHLVGIISRADIVKLYARGSEAVPEINEVAAHGITDRQVKEFLKGFERRFLGIKWIWTKFWVWLALIIFIAVIFVTLFFVLRALELVVTNLPI